MFMQYIGLHMFHPLFTIQSFILKESHKTAIIIAETFAISRISLIFASK